MLAYPTEQGLGREDVQRTWQGTCHASPRMPMFLFRLQERPNANANRKHDDPVSDAHAEEDCTAAEEAELL